MKVNYLLEIDNPQTHQVKLRVHISQNSLNEIELFLPSWSPGSYLMREYSKHLSKFKILDSKGSFIGYEKIKKGAWVLKNAPSEFYVEYLIYCHELTVRTSHVDNSHAFLHLPCLLIGVSNQEILSPQIELRFPALWSKVITGLEDISTNREVFLYSAANYDDLLDCPIEIGCHESDGFKVRGKDHHLAFYGTTWPHSQNLKSDMKKIVETVADYMIDIPYEHYSFITHFAPNLYGGLEHKNSTVLAFDGRKLNNRKDYIKWLTLTTHEYFHTWNIKRIRPVELGPFDYQNENYTSMLWLAEGLTSFMDNYLTLKTGLISEKEYWELIKDDLNLYLSIPGRKYDSLEASSFDAWIKLYRPHENSRNATISYYLKGGLVFLVLHSRLIEIGKSMKDLTDALWNHYKQRPEQGISKTEFMGLVREISNEEIALEFEKMIETTEEIDFTGILKKHSIEISFKNPEYQLGLRPEFKGEQVFIHSIIEDGLAYKIGLNAGDEILSINDTRIDKSFFNSLSKYLALDKDHSITISRMGRSFNFEFRPETTGKLVKNIVDNKKISW